MKYKARVEVRLKPGHSDPEGERTRQLLLDLNYSIESVAVSKAYEITLEAESLIEASVQLNEICTRLLANPVKDDFNFEIWEKMTRYKTYKYKQQNL